MRGKAPRASELAFGEYGLKSQSAVWLSSRQIEAARKAVVHHTKKGGKLWMRVFPDKPISKKPAETRMGGGKAAPEHYVAVVRPGRIILELSGVSLETAKEALEAAAAKLPVRTRFIHS